MNRITTHPGDVLKEELAARGISQKKFSEVLNVPYTQLNEILNGKRPVTTDFALMVEAALAQGAIGLADPEHDRCIRMQSC